MTSSDPYATASDLGRSSMTTNTAYEDTRDALRAAPSLIEHIVSITPFKSTPSADDGVRSKRAMPPMPMNAGAFNDANELYARLTHWTQHWAAVLHVPAPTAVARAWRNHASDVVGLPADIEPHRARDAINIMTTWLGNHLEEIFRRHPEDVAYFATEIAEVQQAAERWPSDTSAHFTGVRCRILGCGGELALWPFQKVARWVEKGQNVFLPPEGARVVCDECGDRWTQEDYRAEVNRRILAVKAQQKADATKLRLLRKYGDLQSKFPKFSGTVAGKVRHNQSSTGWERDPN